jgi:hypothetical protein
MTLQKIVESLANLKKGIDEAKSELLRIDGRETEAVKQLKEIHNLSSVEEIEAKLAELEEKDKILQAEIEAIYKNLQESYDW